MKKSLFITALLLLMGCSGAKDQENLQTPKSFMNFEHKRISANGLTFHYVEKGDGDLMLMLHGFPYFSESWFNLINSFSTDYHTVAPDNRGYGYSDKPENVEDYRIDKLVSDVEQMIKQLSPDKPVILVGHDWGAALAWGIAQVHPERVKKLIIINGAPANTFLKVLSESPLQREKSKYVAKLDSWLAKLMFTIRGPKLFWKNIAPLHETGLVDDNFKAAFMNAWEQPGAAQAAVNWYLANIPPFDEIQPSDYWPNEHARVTVPTLLIWSKNDPAFSEDVMHAIPAVVDDLTTHVIDTNSHAPFLSHPDEVIERIQAFLDTKD